MTFYSKLSLKGAKVAGLAATLMYFTFVFAQYKSIFV